MSYDHTISVRHIPEHPVEGKPLGRHVRHDSRSLAYAYPVQDTPLRSITHQRVAPILDQGQLGSCTGNAAVGALGTEPLDPTIPTATKLDEAEAVKLYSAATKLDDAPGSYPPDDTGSDGLSVAKAVKAAGLCSGYQHALSLNAALSALQKLPVITGVNWYEGFDDVDANGLVKISGQVRGGHEFEVIGCDTDTKVVEAVNSWGESWGVNGHFFFSFDDFERLLSEDGDVTVLLPLGVPAPTPTPAPTPLPTPTPDADTTLTAALDKWLAGKPWFYKSLQTAARKWLEARQ